VFFPRRGVTFWGPRCSLGMKNNNSIALTAFMVALAAIIIVPVGPAAAVTALTLSGMVAIFLADYGRSAAPLMARAS